MPQFLVQFSYAARAVDNLVQQPETDRAGQASAMVASLGATLLGYWYTFGEFDGIALIDAPDNAVVTAIAMAIRSTGDVARLETTVLMTMNEAARASRAARSATHLPGDREDR